MTLKWLENENVILWFCNLFFGKSKRSKKGCLDDDIANKSDYLVDDDEMNIYFEFLHYKCAIAATCNSNSNVHHHLKKSNNESVLEVFNSNFNLIFWNKTHLYLKSLFFSTSKYKYKYKYFSNIFNFFF